MNFIKFLYWATFSYLILICVFSWAGMISYGNGLADAVYAFALLIIVVYQFSIPMYFYLKQNSLSHVYYKVTVFIVLIILVYFTWSFTLGRGPEKKWDGKIFTMNNV